MPKLWPTNTTDCVITTKIHEFNFICYTFYNRDGPFRSLRDFFFLLQLSSRFSESVRDSETNNVIILTHTGERRQSRQIKLATSISDDCFNFCLPVYRRIAYYRQIFRDTIN